MAIIKLFFQSEWINSLFVSVFNFFIQLMDWWICTKNCRRFFAFFKVNLRSSWILSNFAYHFIFWSTSRICADRTIFIHMGIFKWYTLFKMRKNGNISFASVPVFFQTKFMKPIKIQNKQPWYHSNTGEILNKINFLIKLWNGACQ